MIKTLQFILIILFAIIVPLGIFFSPFIISAITGCWWFMFLFWVTWFPAFLDFAFTVAIIDFFDIF